MDGTLVPTSNDNNDTLLSMSTSAPAATVSSTMNDLKGLVLAPIATDSTSSSSHPDLERDSSAWIVLVKPELCGGLQVRARYLRGPTKAREAQLLGMDASSPSVLCLQVVFQNTKTETTNHSIRHVRLLPRSGAASSISTKKVVVPPELLELKQHQSCTGIIGIEFHSASNRDGDMAARFDLKTSTSNVSVEVKPSLAELLQPISLSKEEFDDSIQKLQGFTRLTTAFTLTDETKLLQSIQNHTAFLPVSGSWKFTENKLRLVGKLPGGPTSMAYALIEVSSPNNGRLTVCCEDAVAVNSLLNAMKKAVAEASE